DRLPEDPDPPVYRPDQPQQREQQRGLAGAVRAQQDRHAAAGDPQGHVLEGAGASAVDGEIGDVHGGVGAGTGRPGGIAGHAHDVVSPSVMRSSSCSSSDASAGTSPSASESEST